mmetsp:Transcript_16014/g.28543  ORF Transcript_16014/g.28543 Transcript_16014/m.28543 type:complete len:625 (+) Transcript_16014:95-1969(+)
MILYNSGDYHLRFLFRLQGSVFPRAALFTCPSVGLAVLLSMLLEKRSEIEFLEELNQTSVWSASVIVLGILLAFRTNKAYDRFWEGITLVQQMRAEWFETASNLMAFSEVAAKKDPSDTEMVSKVNEFQLTFIRLMSLMHGAALRQISGYREEFPVLDLQGLDEDTLLYLAGCEEMLSNRVEVLLHWIQVLITDNQALTRVIAVDSPILTRAYQTLSRGMVNLHNARKIADVPFPFPLSQTVVTLVIIQSLVTPIFAATLVKHIGLAAFIAFLPIFGMWSCIFIAGQLEQPFGTDPNDLPLSVLQFDMNASLLMLLDTKKPPSLSKKARRDVAALRRSLWNAKSSTDSVNAIRGKSEGLGAMRASCLSSMSHQEALSQLESSFRLSSRRSSFVSSVAERSSVRSDRSSLSCAIVGSEGCIGIDFDDGNSDNASSYNADEGKKAETSCEEGERCVPSSLRMHSMSEISFAHLEHASNSELDKASCDLRKQTLTVDAVDESKPGRNVLADTSRAEEADVTALNQLQGEWRPFFARGVKWHGSRSSSICALRNLLARDTEGHERPTLQVHEKSHEKEVSTHHEETWHEAAPTLTSAQPLCGPGLEANRQFHRAELVSGDAPKMSERL